MEVGTDNLKKYYDYLVTAKADVPGTFESFSSTLSDEASAKQYYQYLKDSKLDAPATYESFSETLGLKKKVASEYSYPTSKAFTESIPENNGAVAKDEATTPTEITTPLEVPKSKSQFKKTQLSSQDESDFQKWKGTEPENNLYDFRGFYEAEKQNGTLKSSVSNYTKEDPNYHFYSIGVDGKVLKSPDHPTFEKTIEGEKSVGNELFTDKEGTLRTRQKPSVYDEGYSALTDATVKGVHPDGEPVTAENYITAAPQAFNKRFGESIRNVGAMANLPQNTMDYYIEKIGGKNGSAIVSYMRHALGSLPIIGILSKENVDNIATTVEKAGNPKKIPENTAGSVLSTLGSVAFDIATVRAMPTSKLNALAKYGMERVPMFPTYLATMQGGTTAREGKGVKDVAKSTAEAVAAGLTYEGMGVTAGRFGEMVQKLAGGRVGKAFVEGAIKETVTGKQIVKTSASAFANSALFEGDSRIKGGEKWTGAITGFIFSAPEFKQDVSNIVKQSVAKRAYVSYLTTTDNAIRNISKMNLDPAELRKQSDELWQKHEDFTKEKGELKPIPISAKELNEFDKENARNIRNLNEWIKEEPEYPQWKEQKDLLISDRVAFWERKKESALTQIELNKTSKDPDPEADIDLATAERMLKTAKDSKFNDEIYSHEDILEEKTVIDNMINVNAMTQAIIENPTAFLNEINKDVRLSDAEKAKWTAKIRSTVNFADPRIDEAMPIWDKIAELKQSVKDAETLYPDENVRNEKVTIIEEQIKEQEKLASKTISRPLGAQPRYEMSGSPIEKDEALNLIKQAENVGDLEGMKIQNDSAVEKALQDKFGEEAMAKKAEEIKKSETAPKEEIATEEKLSIGDKSFTDKSEMFKHLKEVALTETGQIKKGWMTDVEGKSLNDASMKAINEWEKTKIKKSANTYSEGSFPEEKRPTAETVGKTPVARKKRTAAFKPGTRTFAAVDKTPNDFAEAVLQFFVGGGRIKTQDLMDHTGYKKGDKDLNVLFGLHAKDGMAIDVFNEALGNSFGRGKGDEGMDMINEVMDIILSYPSRGKMLSELERRQGDQKQLEPSDEEIKAEEDALIAEGKARDLAESYDIDQDLKNGLITKAEYDEITDYLNKQAEQEQLAEESFNTDLVSQGETGKKETGKPEEVKAESEKLHEAWSVELKKNGVSKKSEALRQKSVDFNVANFEVGVNHIEGIDHMSKMPYSYGEIDYSKISGWADNSPFFDVSAGGKFVPNELGRQIGIRFSDGGGSAFLNFKYTPENAKLVSDALKENGYKTNELSNEKPINDKPNPPISKGEENNLPAGADTGNKPIEKQGEAKPVRTTDPVKQKQIDVIDTEYDKPIADKQKELDGIPDQIDRAVKKANERNGLFGDNAPVGKDEIIPRDEQGFKVSLDAVRKPFEERKAQLTKEIDALNKDRESKIGEVLNQQSFDWESMLKPETPEEKAISDAKIKEQENTKLEADYQKSSFDKKWAPTREVAISKLKQTIADAEARIKDWSSRVYKSSGGKKVEVGKDNDFDLKNVDVDKVNEKRRQQVIKGAQEEITEAKKDLKTLGFEEPAKVEPVKKETTNTLNDAVSKYGWSAVKNPEGFWLQNKDGKPVVKVVVNGKKGTYKFLDMSGTKLMDGRGQIEKSAEKLLKDRYYAKEGKPTASEIKPEVNKVDILSKKHGGSLFKGETWKDLVDKVGEYFLPKFNKPLTLENRSDVLSDNFTRTYGEKDVAQFVEDYKKYPDASVSIKAENHSVSFPKEVADYLSDKLSKAEPKVAETPPVKETPKLDLLGNPKDESMLTFDERAKIRFEGKANVTELDRQNLRTQYQRELDRGYLKKYVEEGRMTQAEADAVLESAGLKAPENKVEQLSVRDLKGKTVPELDDLISQLESGMKDLLDNNETARAEKMRDLIGTVIDYRNRDNADYNKAVNDGKSPFKDEPPIPKVEQPTEGVKFKDKTYTDVDQVQDALDNGEITFEEQKPLMQKVREFEDGLRNNAEKNSKDSANRIDKGAGDFENQIKKDINDKNSKLFLKFFPDFWSALGTAQWKIFSPVRDRLANVIANQLKKGVTTQTDGIRWSTKVLTNLYNGLLRSQADMHGAGIPGQIGKLEMAGAREYGKYKARTLLETWRGIVNGDWDSLARVWSVLDPKLATKPTESPLTYGDLGLAEKNLYFAMKEWMTWGHETTYANGLIPTKTYLKFKDVTGSSNYIARMYDKFEMDILSDPAIKEFAERGNDSYTSKIAADIYKARKELNGIVEINGHEYDSMESLKEARDNGEITADQYAENKDAIKSDEWRREHAIKDPTYLVAKRVMQTIQNVAIKKYMDAVIANHPEYVLTIPKKAEVPKGFRRIGSSYAWGPFRNKVVASHIVEDLTGFFYQNALVNTTYDAMKLLDRTKFTQFYKKFRTIYNPFVQLGNVTGNVFFATTNGLNPGAFIKGMWDNRNIPKRNPVLYESLLKAGYIGPYAMTGEMKPLDTLNPKKGLLGKADEWATKAYVGADNLAKISAYQIYRRQGLTHAQALRRGYDAFQNYATVGKTWDFASKTPLIGPTFVKFQADLQRILVNSMLTTPITTIGTFMLIKLLGNVSSALSGESEEEQKEREKRKGVPSIPFLNIPLSFKVGKSEVNVARYLTPLYLYNKGDSEMELEDISKFSPYQIQKGEEGKIFPKFVFADATWGFLGSIWTDKDFRNRSIADPKKTTFTDPNTPTDVKIWNIINYVGRSQIPFWKGSADIYNAATGQLDYYERKRTFGQAILNNIIKIQQFDKPELKNYVEHNLNYLTSRYASLAAKMGDAQRVFYKAMKDAEDKGLSVEAQKQIYKSASKLRDKSIGKSLEEQMPVYQEIERLTSVYKKWNPKDPFIEENFQNIESGKNQRFNVLNDVDLQKKYPTEYSILKKNDLLNKPVIPSYWKETQLTEAERKNYSNIYWSEYLRNLNSMGLTTQEEMDDAKKSITNIIESTTHPTPDKTTMLQEMAADAASSARDIANESFRIKKQ